MNIELKIIENLRVEFLELFDDVNCSEEDVQKLFEKIIKAYTSKDRYYHNLNHIQNFLKFITKNQNNIQIVKTLKMAVWFHDVIYDTKVQDNEEKSALYANKSLKELHVTPEIISQVELLILATKTHESFSKNKDSEIFLDGDLLILGSSEETFDRYAESIRKEYSWVSDEKYRVGRIKVLEDFLKRDRIYFTDETYDKFEKYARSNIKREIKSLK